MKIPAVFLTMKMANRFNYLPSFCGQSVVNDRKKVREPREDLKTKPVKTFDKLIAKASNQMSAFDLSE